MAANMYDIHQKMHAFGTGGLELDVLFIVCNLNLR